MTRVTTQQKMGSYTYQFGTQNIGTFASVAFEHRLERADPAPGQRDGGWIHPTNYWASRADEIHPYGEWKVTKFKKLNIYKGHLAQLADASPSAPGYSFTSFEQRVANGAYIKALNELLGEDAFNLAQNIVERQQAIDLVADRFGSIVKSYRFLRKKKWKQAFRALGLHGQKIARRASENILAWNFGVAPLVDDIKSAVRMFQSDGPDQFVMVKGSSREGELGRAKIVDQNNGNLPRRIHFSETRYAQCKLWVRPDNFQEIRNAAMGLNNWPLLVYEVIPYSFLVDYGWAIGNWLSALGATSGWSFYSGYLMERTENLSVYEGLSTSNNGQSTLTGQRTMKQFRRTRLMTFPTPGLPGFKNPFSLIHALNVVALVGVRT